MQLNLKIQPLAIPGSTRTFWIRTNSFQNYCWEQIYRYSWTVYRKFWAFGWDLSCSIIGFLYLSLLLLKQSIMQVMQYWVSSESPLTWNQFSMFEIIIFFGELSLTVVVEGFEVIFRLFLNCYRDQKDTRLFYMGRLLRICSNITCFYFQKCYFYFLTLLFSLQRTYFYLSSCFITLSVYFSSAETSYLAFQCSIFFTYSQQEGKPLYFRSLKQLKLDFPRTLKSISLQKLTIQDHFSNVFSAVRQIQLSPDLILRAAGIISSFLATQLLQFLTVERSMTSVIQSFSFEVKVMKKLQVRTTHLYRHSFKNFERFNRKPYRIIFFYRSALILYLDIISIYIKISNLLSDQQNPIKISIIPTAKFIQSLCFFN